DERAIVPIQDEKSFDFDTDGDDAFTRFFEGKPPRWTKQDTERLRVLEEKARNEARYMTDDELSILPDNAREIEEARRREAREANDNRPLGHLPSSNGNGPRDDVSTAGEN